MAASLAAVVFGLAALGLYWLVRGVVAVVRPLLRQRYEAPLSQHQIETLLQARAIVEERRGVDLFGVERRGALDLDDLTAAEERVILDAFAIREEFTESPPAEPEP